MAINKSALIRYQVLDRCFRNPGRKYFINDLLEECNNALFELSSESMGIQKRQLYDDIRFMESETGWSVPLERMQFGSRVHYKYSDLNFSINNQPLNKSEADQLKSALLVMSRFTGAPQFEWVNEIVTILEDKLGLVGHQKEVVAFDSNLDLTGLNFMKPIFSAIVNKTVLKITYKDFKSLTSYIIEFHPYYLKQYNSRWFAFGLNSEKPGVIWNLALDRIQQVEDVSAEYMDTEIDWNDYFFDIIGVTKPLGREVEKVVLRFNEEQAPYILTKPLHPTQRKKILENGIEVSIEVIQNFELERLILSFGERVEVIEPIDLRDRISDYLEHALNQYV